MEGLKHIDINTGNEEKTISLRSWKDRAANLNRERGWSKYYSNISFHQLVIESEYIFNQMSQNKLKSELVMMSRLILKEIQSRLETKSMEMGQDIEVLRNNIDRKIINLIRKS